MNYRENAMQIGIGITENPLNSICSTLTVSQSEVSMSDFKLIKASSKISLFSETSSELEKSRNSRKNCAASPTADKPSRKHSQKSMYQPISAASRQKSLCS